MTLSDLHGHFIKCDFSYTVVHCAVLGNISPDAERYTVASRQLSLL